MATPVVMPQQGNTVESCIIVAWKKQAGETVAQGEVLCEVETDKALVEVESPASGTLLAVFFDEGAEVPVMTTIAAIGEPGENVDDLRPAGGAAPAVQPPPTEPAAPPPEPEPPAAVPAGDGESRLKISPRARTLARQKAVAPHTLTGSGPGGRIIERDVLAALEARPRMTPLARSMVDSGAYVAPARGSGPGGRVTAADLTPVAPETPAAPAAEVEVIPVRGIRRLIADRMLESLQTTAQLTLNTSADARAVQDYRRRLKTSPEAMGLQNITINDLILFAVSRVLPQYPDLNALFTGEEIHRYRAVHLGMAVDTPRGLMVPVIRHADQLSLKALAQESKRLAAACLENKISPDDLQGGTFTVTNLGSLGIESFTPVLNPPQVAILGVGSIQLKPVQGEDGVQFIPHLGLSLTINHQVVDGAPAARFLQALSQALARFDLLLAG